MLECIKAVLKEYEDIFPQDLPPRRTPARTGHEFSIDLEDDTLLVHRLLYKLSPLELEGVCYGARSSISMLRVPTVGTHNWKRIQEETVTLVGPMTLEESLQIRNNRLSTPVTVSGIHSNSKTRKYMIMYN